MQLVFVMHAAKIQNSETFTDACGHAKITMYDIELQLPTFILTLFFYDEIFYVTIFYKKHYFVHFSS